MDANPPDLAVVSIEHLRCYSHKYSRMMDRSYSYFPTAYFLVKLTNLGKGPFEGWLKLEWSENNSINFTSNVITPIPSDKINIGDTILVGFETEHRYYLKGTHLWFHLVGIKKDRLNPWTLRDRDYSPIIENDTSDNYSEITIASERDIYNGQIFDIH